MRVNARKILFPILMFGFLFGVSSTANADALSFTTFSFNQIQFTSSSGTAVFTMTAFTTRAVAQNSLGAIQVISPTEKAPDVTSPLGSAVVDDPTPKLGLITPPEALANCTLALD